MHLVFHCIFIRALFKVCNLENTLSLARGGRLLYFCVRHVADKYVARPLTCMWSWWKSLVFCSRIRAHTLCTSRLWKLPIEQQQAVSALWTVPPQRPAGMFEPEALLSNTTTPTQVRLGTPRLSPALRFATSRSWLCVRARTDDSTGVTQPFPHIRISSTQSYSICMEIWAPQLESHKALSSTNSYYRFGLLPHKNPAIQAHRIFMVMPYNNSPKLWCIDLCYHYDNSHSHLTPHYTIETARGWI